MKDTQSPPKPRGILMCGEMIRATLRAEDPKTQTRRIVDMDCLRVRLESEVRSDAMLSMIPSFKPLAAPPGIHRAKMNQHGATSVVLPDGELGVKPGEFHFECPYAKGDTHLGNYGKRANGRDLSQWTITPRGSRLYVKETFGIIPDDEGAYVYRATDPEWGTEAGLKWKPGIFMPCEASRILIEVTQVRVQRVQDISEEDAIAEGCEMDGDLPKEQPCGKGMQGWDSAQEWYQDLWNSLNLGPKPAYERIQGRRVIVRYEAFPWSMEDFKAKLSGYALTAGRLDQITFRGLPLIIHANPWVWAITFKRIQP